jgi:hypothetical protein
MRLLLIVLGVAAVMAAPGSSAQAQNYPWCAQYGGSMGGAMNCGFVSYDQCMGTVNGIGGVCIPNNTYVPPAGPHAAKRRSHRSS